MELTKDQLTALALLDKAFAKAKKAKLSFAGMDGELYFASEAIIDKCRPYFNESWWREYSQVPKTVSIDSDKFDSGCSGTVKTHGAYSDSGGW